MSKGLSEAATVNGPEPCITSFSTGRCYSPIACGTFGYCRDRNLKFGFPDDATALAWRNEVSAGRAAIPTHETGRGGE